MPRPKRPRPRTVLLGAEIEDRQLVTELKICLLRDGLTFKQWLLERVVAYVRSHKGSKR
jgi:hypothetical protein